MPKWSLFKEPWMRALERCERDPRGAEQVVALLKQEPPAIPAEHRIRALRVVAEFFEKEEISRLEQACEAEPLSKWRSVSPLSELMSLPYLRPLKAAVAQRENDLRRAAAAAYRRMALGQLLPRLGARSDLAGLARLLEDSDPEIREKAGHEYKQVAFDRVFPAHRAAEDLNGLAGMFSAPVAEVAEQARGLAAEVLNDLKNAGVCEPLLAVIRQQNPDLMDLALDAAAEMAEQDPKLLSHLQDRCLDGNADLAAEIMVIHQWARRFGPPPPDFFPHRLRPQIKEFLEAPKTSIYGGLPTLWFFKDRQGEVRRVMVTGHAYPSVCARISRVCSQFFTELPLRDSSLLLAGMIRCDLDLVAQTSMSDWRMMLETIQERLKERVEVFIAGLPPTSDLQQYGDQFRLAMLLERLQGKGSAADVLNDLLRDLRSIESDCGLVRIERARYEELEDVEGAVLTQAAVSRPGLEGPWPNISVPVLVPFSGQQALAQPLVIDVPMAIFGLQHLGQLEESYRLTTRRELLSETARRRRFYDSTFEVWVGTFRRLTRERAVDPEGFERQEIPIHIRINMDTATEERLPEPEVKSAHEYLEGLPQSIVDAMVWQLKMELQEEQIKRAYETALPFRDQATLLDAIIRGWDLPYRNKALDVVREEWQRSCRPGAVSLIARALSRSGVELTTLAEEGWVFPVVEVEAGKVLVPF